MVQFVSIPLKISHETIDGETIVIDLEKGLYYSLEHTASEIWNALDQGGEVFLVSQMYGKENAEAVKNFIDSLHDEGLLIYSEERKVVGGVPSSNGEFTVPEYHKFDDMEDLLLLDPIHETDESGWPHKLVEKPVKL